MARNSETTPADAEVTVSDAGVEVAPSTSDKFEPITMYHRISGKEKRVASLEGKYAAEFEGYGTIKPKKR